MRRIIPDDRARQGASGRPVLLVLVSALALLGIALVAFMIWVGATSPDDPTQEASREAVTGSPSGSSTANPTNRVQPGNPAYPVPTDPSATGATRQ